jgi:hypothetical protein
MSEDTDKRLDRILRDIQRRLEEEPIEPDATDDFIFTEQEEKAWLDSERDLGQDFAKRIATPLPTKHRRRVTTPSKAYICLLLPVTKLGVDRDGLDIHQDDSADWHIDGHTLRNSVPSRPLPHPGPRLRRLHEPDHLLVQRQVRFENGRCTFSN